MNNTLKSVLFAIMLVALAVVAIMGWHWEDVAKSKFWWTFWPIAALASIIGFGFIVAWFGRNRSGKR